MIEYCRTEDKVMEIDGEIFNYPIYTYDEVIGNTEEDFCQILYYEIIWFFPSYSGSEVWYTTHTEGFYFYVK